MFLFVSKQTKQRIPAKEITFVIGRGSILQVNDKKVSRNHGIINVLDPDGVINVKSTHPNPIFYKQQEVGELKILHKDQDVTLSAGDSFGLLENDLWYEIATDCGASSDETSQAASQEADEIEDTQNYSDPVVKEEEDAVQSATVDTPPPAIDAVPGTIVELPPATVEVTSAPADGQPDKEPARRIPAWMVTQSEAEPSTKRPVDKTTEEDAPKRIKVEDTSDPSTSGLQNIPAATSPPVVVKTEPPDTHPKVASADSSTRRPTCNFGVRCYRKRNPIHAAAEAHPGDTDYRRPDFPPAPADAPPCPYGASCYRRNPRHFLEHSHPDSSIYFPANLQQQISNNKRRRLAVNYTIHVNIGDTSDDADSEEDFQASDDEEYDPNKTEPEDSDEDDSQSQPVASEELL